MAAVATLTIPAHADMLRRVRGQSVRPKQVFRDRRHKQRQDWRKEEA
jgi:hypothetical protein